MLPRRLARAPLMSIEALMLRSVCASDGELQSDRLAGDRTCRSTLKTPSSRTTHHGNIFRRSPVSEAVD